MSLYLRVIQVSEIDEILDFENRKLKDQFPDDTERALHSWNTPWRRESLEHYFSTGWSFLARDQERSSSFSSEGELVGYFMAQPLLFFDGQTQSLWVEHLQFSSLQARDELCDLAYRMAREKHFQRAYLPNIPSLAPLLKSMKFTEWNSQAFFIKTTKV
jgi:hypothetical protein